MIRIKMSFSRSGAVYCVRYPIESPEDLVEVLKEGATLAERTRPRSDLGRKRLHRMLFQPFVFRHAPKSHKARSLHRSGGGS